jgi:hypothetical protein
MTFLAENPDSINSYNIDEAVMDELIACVQFHFQAILDGDSDFAEKELDKAVKWATIFSALP